MLADEMSQFYYVTLKFLKMLMQTSEAREDRGNKSDEGIPFGHTLFDARRIGRNTGVG